jgi:hypothetical protein
MLRRLFVCVILVLSAAAVSHAAVVESEEPLVFDSRGVRLTAPAGWMMYGGMRKHSDILAVFCRLPYDSPDTDNPRMVLLAQKPGRKGPFSALEKAYRDAEVLMLMRNLRDVERAGLSGPPESDPEAGYTGFSYEIARREGKKSYTIRSCEYVFYENGTFYVLLCGSRPEAFEKYREEFERTAKSLKFGR